MNNKKNNDTIEINCKICNRKHIIKTNNIRRGYVAHGQKDLIDKYNHELTIALLALCGIGIVYVVIKWIVSAKKRKATESTDLE